VSVESVVPGSAADKAGLVGGDVITRAGGRTVTSPTSLQNVMFQASPGKPLPLTWSDQYGNTSSATVRPGAGPPQ